MPLPVHGVLQPVEACGSSPFAGVRWKDRPLMLAMSAGKHCGSLFKQSEAIAVAMS
jgi:hypothetical protein